MSLESLLRSVKRKAAAGLLGLSLALSPVYGCGSGEGETGSPCSTDSDCKMERVCEEGRCNDSSTTSAEEPSNNGSGGNNFPRNGNDTCGSYEQRIEKKSCYQQNLVFCDFFHESGLDTCLWKSLNGRIPEVREPCTPDIRDSCLVIRDEDISTIPGIFNCEGDFFAYLRLGINLKSERADGYFQVKVGDGITLIFDDRNCANVSGYSCNGNVPLMADRGLGPVDESEACFGNDYGRSIRVQREHGVTNFDFDLYAHNSFSPNPDCNGNVNFISFIGSSNNKDSLELLVHFVEMECSQ